MYVYVRIPMMYIRSYYHSNGFIIAIHSLMFVSTRVQSVLQLEKLVFISTVRTFEGVHRKFRVVGIVRMYNLDISYKLYNVLECVWTDECG